MISPCERTFQSNGSRVWVIGIQVFVLFCYVLNNYSKKRELRNLEAGKSLSSGKLSAML
jgi:hypothetical protein